ncbi:Rhamnogalacturonase B, N-terminal-domain-containing protein [Lasiosphaeris hirsuta]|uniref:rhamnogalacturonan endolyase n=1 Tax=Lasiosphaeris hirsuta TaxID=260670 RepID=A0AA40A1J2_9PEZI|nr:Rhamnogalacturonase B, N-terminal-domain-containing protein [Lasiosphaeris hirsuta]
MASISLPIPPRAWLQSRTFSCCRQPRWGSLLPFDWPSLQPPPLSLSLALCAFGYTSSGGNYIVDPGSANPLIFSVSQSNCDIKSIKFRSTELQYGSQGTHIGPGLGSATISISQGSGSKKYIKVTCVTSTVTHYMVVREGESAVYLATYITAQPSIGELSFIACLLPDQLSEEYPYGTVSNTNGASSAVEGSDVYTVNGQTRSKFYSSTRFIDEDSHCVYGGSDQIHVCIMTPQQESSSGGPFFRDIDSNNAGASTNLYNYMNSGHTQTEAYRIGLHGPYLMAFTRSGVPSVKSAAQYWAKTSSNGAFTSPLMKPGTYTMVLYQTEYKISTSSVSVSAGKTTNTNIAGSITPTNRKSLFKIGEYDGQPTGFRNANKFLRMHPSQLSDFPMTVFQSANNPVTIRFNLGSAPGAATLRIATTLAFAGGRPQTTVNGWSAANPSAPTKIYSHGVTRGAYRGNGEVYDVSIPSSKLVAGSNTITVGPLSGSSGDTVLSPNFVITTCFLSFCY